MDVEDTDGADEIDPNTGVSTEVVQAVAYLRQQKLQAAALAKALHDALRSVEATETFISDQVHRFSLDAPHLQAALVATSFVQVKGLSKAQRLAQQVACTILPQALRLTTRSSTLHCTTEVPLARPPGIPFVDGLSFRLKHARMRDVFAHPTRNVVSSLVIALGFHPIEQYLSIDLEGGTLPLSTVPTPAVEEPGHAETFTSAQPIRPDVLAQGLQAIFIGLTNKGEDLRYQTVDVSGGRMRAASYDTCSAFDHPALNGLALTFHADDAPQLIDIFQRFLPGRTHVSTSPGWHRFDDGVLTLWAKRPAHDIVPGIDRTLREAAKEALVHATVDREKLWQLLTVYRYFLRVQLGERLGGIAFPAPPARDAKPDTPVKMWFSARSRFEPNVEPVLAIPVEPEASLLDPDSVQAASERQQVDFVQLERLTRWSASERLSLRLGDAGLLVSDRGDEWRVLNLLQTHRH